MTATFIVTTPRHQMHALAFQGIRVVDCHRQLSDILRHRLGDDFASLLAEPSINAHDYSVDWYSSLQGQVQPLQALPQEEQNALRQQLAQMAQQMQALAQELQQSSQHTQVTSGHILELALRYPSEDCLYVVAGRPVFTCWGFGPGTPGAEPQDLCRLSSFTPPPAQPRPAPPAAPAVPPPAAEVPPAAGPLVTETSRGLWPFLLWLLPLALLLVLLWFLFTAFGHWPALSGTNLFHAPALPGSQLDQTALARQESSNAALEKDVLDLRAQLDKHLAQCQRKTAPSTAEPREELIIPEHSKDLNFMAGRWRCETDLVNSSGAPIVVEFEFDDKGRGKGRVYEDTRTCQGRARAGLTPEGLHLTLDEQVCGDGSRYSSQDIICRQGKGSARCFGRNAGGKPWEARFLRYKE